jgi:Copper binding proteins, plastocyanin/azurin family
MKHMLVAACTAALATVLPAAGLAAPAATPTYRGSVGPGFTITLPHPPTKPGRVKLVVSDRSSSHDFHLTGPGVNVSTTVGGTGTKTFTITLKKGTYRYMCDPHKSFMKGSFTIR